MDYSFWYKPAVTPTRSNPIQRAVGTAANNTEGRQIAAPSGPVIRYFTSGLLYFIILLTEYYLRSTPYLRGIYQVLTRITLGAVALGVCINTAVGLADLLLFASVLALRGLYT